MGWGLSRHGFVDCAMARDELIKARLPRQHGFVGYAMGL